LTVEVDQNQTAGTLVSILRSVYPYIRMDIAQQSVRGAFKNQSSNGNSNSAKQVFLRVHDILKKGSNYLFADPIPKGQALQVVCRKFQALIPSKINPPAGVSLVKVRRRRL